MDKTSLDWPGRAAVILYSILFVLGLAAAIFYFSTGNSIVGRISKSIPVLLMALALIPLIGKSTYIRLVFLGLVFGASADFLIDSSFLLGLVVFLISHLAYIAAFFQDTRRVQLSRGLPAFAFGAFVYIGVMIVGSVGALAVPVGFYSLAISVMLWRASERLGLTSIPRRSALAGFVGAILFILSDSILAYRLFVGPLPLEQINVMLPYWLGQLGIALSAIWHLRSEPTADAHLRQTR
ncbi:lysoplasmalogenase [Aureliella helgolandensis]|uniref:YhhN-like protein n=1 Tax=Aureliella helgolandensis TaxID=2527968 RepID=A0A518GA63_9BACT|nr:lysoplasmalogenase [Aureliella helgolandensis]QDV25488.1 YhhN-like protein [Aureliella helgolandensis]